MKLLTIPPELEEAHKHLFSVYMVDHSSKPAERSYWQKEENLIAADEFISAASKALNEDFSSYTKKERFSYQIHSSSRMKDGVSSIEYLIDFLYAEIYGYLFRHLRLTTESINTHIEETFQPIRFIYDEKDHYLDHIELILNKEKQKILVKMVCYIIEDDLFKDRTFFDEDGFINCIYDRVSGEKHAIIRQIA